MSSPKLDPINVPVEWHGYLYRSVLLPWETTLKYRKNFQRFDGQKPLEGISVVKQNSLDDVKAAYRRVNKSPRSDNYLVFYANGAALKDLMALLRNCVAHGHYSKSMSGWILFRHEYQGKLKLFGQMRFSRLKKLVAIITSDKVQDKES